MNIRIKRVDRGAIVPQYQTDGASGLDLHALDEVTIPAGGRVTVDTGIAFEIPRGFEGHIRPRSGLARRDGVVAVYGTIDSDFRGAVGVTLVNLSDTERFYEPGARIAQIAFAPVVRVTLEEVDELTPTKRGTGGFGSTGK